MKKGEILEGIVERVDFPNKGIIIREDGKLTVKNVLPGQKISFRVKKIRKGKAEGTLLSVLERSAEEIESPCLHFDKCGGCTYQNLPYEEQLKLKEAQVKKLLDAVYTYRAENPSGAYCFEGIKGSPQAAAYRNKMEFTFGDEVKEGPLSLGMHRRGSFYDIVTVSGCQIVDGDFRLILDTVLGYFRGGNAEESNTASGTIPYYHRLRHEGYLRHLLVRKAQKTGEILIALITSTQLEMDLTALTEHLLALQNEGQQDGKRLSGRIVGILHTLNDSLADVVKSDETRILYGQDYFYEELLGMRFKISQFSFFQTNSLGAEVLYETARSYAGPLCGSESKPDKVIFDLYSGTGTIAQLLSPVAKKVVGVEIVEEAVEAAKVNAALNGINNCEFIAGDVLKVLDSITDKPDMIVLDPPRDGIHPKALMKIIAYGVERIVYISCKPTSLARDLEVFLENGYRMEKAVCVDMFPGTVHVECVVKLCRVEK